MSPSKTLSRWILCISIITGFALFPALIPQLIFKRPAQNSPKVVAAAIVVLPPKPAMTISGFPLRLKIPKINVNAALDYVNLASQGELGVPAGPANAGWYNHGPRPGDNGNAVIDGHFGWKDNIPAVFDNLHELQAGDYLYVEDDQGMTTTFVVREVRSYAQNEDDSAVFVPSDGKSHLNLITCEGVWSVAQKSYSNRLVVFADKQT